MSLYYSVSRFVRARAREIVLEQTEMYKQNKEPFELKITIKSVDWYGVMCFTKFVTYDTFYLKLINSCVWHRIGLMEICRFGRCYDIEAGCSCCQAGNCHAKRKL